MEVTKKNLNRTILISAALLTTFSIGKIAHDYAKQERFEKRCKLLRNEDYDLVDKKDLPKEAADCSRFQGMRYETLMFKNEGIMQIWGRCIPVDNPPKEQFIPNTKSGDDDLI
jgi:hypothetical protein